MEEIRYRARVYFNSKYRDLDAKNKDGAEREAQDFACQFEDVDLIDIEEVYKDKDSCNEHFNFNEHCGNCKEILRKNVEG